MIEYNFSRDIKNEYLKKAIKEHFDKEIFESLKDIIASIFAVQDKETRDALVMVTLSNMIILFKKFGVSEQDIMRIIKNSLVKE